MAKFRSNITSDGSILIITMDDLKAHSVHASNTNLKAIKDALKNPETTKEELLDLISPAKKITRASVKHSCIEVIDGVLLFQGKEVHNALANRILNVVNEGFDVWPWVIFAENVFANPAGYAQDELYLFLMSCNLPISNDGRFPAFKKVRADYTDCHSGKFDNSVGSRPSMPREAVDSNRARTCSAGLHFCSAGYLKHFGGQRTMIVAVDPRDVVSIPHDYNNAKGRACKYEVIAEVPQGISVDELITKTWPAVVDLKKDLVW